MLERRGRTAARHLAEDREGTLGCAPAEARLRATSADSERVSSHHRARSPPTRPRSGTTDSEGLTAPAPAARKGRGRGVLSDTLARRNPGRRVSGAGKGPAVHDGIARAGNLSREPPHHRAAALDAPAR